MGEGYGVPKLKAYYAFNIMSCSPTTLQILIEMYDIHVQVYKMKVK